MLDDATPVLPRSLPVPVDVVPDIDGIGLRIHED